MKNIILSKRMEAVADMVPPRCLTAVDVGCDHAYVSIALIKRQAARKVIAMDVRKGPLEIAGRNIDLYGERNFIELRLSDGLDKLVPGEADVIIIAGMGGLLIRSILEKGKTILSGGQSGPVLILQPQSDIKEVRMFLYQNAYHIVQEKMLLDEGKYYTVIKAEPDDGLQVKEYGAGDRKEDFFSEAEWVYGRYNLERRDSVLYAYLKKEKDTLEGILEKLKKTVQSAGQNEESVPEKTLERVSLLKKEIAVNLEALEYYDTEDRVGLCENERWGDTDEV